MTWLSWLIAVLCALAAMAIGLTAYGNARWAAATRVLLGRLEAARISPTTWHYDVRELEGLPAPVQRYFCAVLKGGQRLITAATVEHTGAFNLSQTGERWKPFKSRQRVVTRSPGFLWDACIEIVPGFAVRVRDAYIGGGGLLRGCAGPLHDGRSAWPRRHCPGRADAVLRRGGVVSNRATAKPGGAMVSGG
jgi:hypothetical protein